MLHIPTHQGSSLSATTTTREGALPSKGVCQMKPLSSPPKFIYVAALVILLAVSFLAGSLITRDQHANAQGVNNTANPAASLPDTGGYPKMSATQRYR